MKKIDYMYNTIWDPMKTENIIFVCDGTADGVDIIRGGKKYFVPVKERGRRGFDIEKDFISIDGGAAGFMKFILYGTCNIARAEINAVIDRFTSEKGAAA